jgi:hypothetical protein
MRVLKLLVILPVIFMTLPARAADAKTGASAGDAARPEDAERQKVQSPADRAERPKQETVKMSPTVHVSPLPPDENSRIRRVVPARGDSPLLNMPAPKDMSSPQGGETSGIR